MINLYDLTRSELTDLLASWGYSLFHVDQVWAEMYRELVTELRGVRRDVLARISAEAHLPQPHTAADLRSSDGFTRKFLLTPLDKNAAIETVIMQFKGRTTACLSTQAGCAMGCIFCATGQMGFTRHLSAGEIVAQVVYVQRKLAEQGDTLRNIVLMGMGEPLHNYDNVIKALNIITDHKGLSIAAKHITISTVGLPQRIRQLADEGHPYRLAVSLHGATDAQRQALVPVAKKWTLEKVIDACRYYADKRKKRIFFEWALIAGENDQPEQAHKLGQLLEGIEATVNVIPLNPTGGYAGAPSTAANVDQFRHILRDYYGLRCTIRQRRGIDIAAGCGQLKAQVERLR